MIVCWNPLDIRIADKPETGVPNSVRNEPFFDTMLPPQSLHHSREKWQEDLAVIFHLEAPDCAIQRHYLSDTLLLRAMGCLVSQHGQLGATPPPPF